MDEMISLSFAKGNCYEDSENHTLHREEKCNCFDREKIVLDNYLFIYRICY